ncbi:MAG TPA: hypothetical protein VF453_06440 [Burkholderiaceae bacterium]
MTNLGEKDTQDMHEIFGRLDALTAAVRALVNAFPDPDEARRILLRSLDSECGRGLSPEHRTPWAQQGVDAVLDELRIPVEP